MIAEAPGPDPRHLFVYGTLRSGGRAPASLRRLLRARGHRVGQGVVEGRLHDAGAYPAAVAPEDPGASDEDGDGSEGERETGEIRGTVFLLEEPEEVLRALDGYEGVEPGGGGLFRREAVDVRLDDGRIVAAWIYWYDRDPDRLPEITGGDWREARRSEETDPGG